MDDDVMLEVSIAFPSPRRCKDSSEVVGVFALSDGGGEHNCRSLPLHPEDGEGGLTPLME